MEYKQEVQKYGKKDAVIALCAFVVAVALSMVDWILTTTFESHATIFQFVGRVLIIGMTVAIVLVKKQGLASIGCHKNKLIPALRFSLLLIIVFSAFGVIPGLIYGWEFNRLGTLIPILFTTIFMAAGEDIFFVGYLQTRLHGLFKNSALAIFVGAICFALIHVPIGLLSPFPYGWVTSWVIWIIGHTFMVLIFRRHFSIIPVIIAHTLANFFTGGSLWREFNFDYNADWASTAIILVFVILLVLEIVKAVRKKA